MLFWGTSGPTNPASKSQCWNGESMRRALSSCYLRTLTAVYYCILCKDVFNSCFGITMYFFSSLRIAFLCFAAFCISDFPPLIANAICFDICETGLLLGPLSLATNSMHASSSQCCLTHAFNACTVGVEEYLSRTASPYGSDVTGLP